MDIEKTYEVKFPVYRKFSKNMFYKIIDNEKAIRVSPESLDTVLAVSGLERTEDSTEQEFEEAFTEFLKNYELTRI